MLAGSSNKVILHYGQEIGSGKCLYVFTLWDLGTKIGQDITIWCFKMINPNKWSKVWVCGSSISEIVESNPAGDMEICLL